MKMNIEDRNWFATNFQKFYKIWLWAEIWVDRWIHAKMILENFKGFVLLVDPWEKQTDWNSDINNRDYSKMYNLMLSNTDWLKRLIAKTTSKEMSENLLDESLDFVYIDAQHSYKGCMEDLELWYPKVRKWWLVSWHDYINAKKWDFIWKSDKKFVEDFWVKQAVDEFAKKYWYTVNKTHKNNTWYFLK
jgi:hypothetical protein